MMQTLKEYHSPMTLDQVINHLKNGENNRYAYPQKVVRIPTITHMIKGLQLVKAQLKDTNKKNKRIQQLTQVISFYNSALQKMGRGEQLQMNEKQHCNMTELMRFYNNICSKVSTIQAKVSGYNKNIKLTFWQKVQTCLSQYQVIADNYDKLKNMNQDNAKINKKSSQCYQNQIAQLNKKLQQYKLAKYQRSPSIATQNSQNSDYILTNTKIKQIHRLYQKLAQGDIQGYYKVYINYAQSYKIPYLQQLMRPIVDNYSKLKLIQDKLKSMCQNKFQQNVYFKLLTQKILIQIQYIQRNMLNKNTIKQIQIKQIKQVQQALANKLTHYSKNTISHQLSDKQVQSLQTLLNFIKSGKMSYQQYKIKQGQLNRKYNIPIGLFDYIGDQFGRIRDTQVLLCQILYTDKNSYQSIQGQTLADKCKWLAYKIQDVIIKKSQQLHKQLNTGAIVYNKNIYSLFNMYKIWFQAKQKVINQVLDNAQKAQKTPQPQFIQNTQIHGQAQNYQKRIQIKNKDPRLKAKTQKYGQRYPPQQQQSQDIAQILQRQQNIINTQFPAQLRTERQKHMKIKIQTQLLKQIKQLQYMNYDKFKYQYRKQLTNQNRYQLSLCQKVVSCVIELLSKILQLPTGLDLFTFIGELSYIKSRQQYNKQDIQTGKQKQQQQLLSSQEIIHNLTKCNDQLNSKNTLLQAQIIQLNNKILQQSNKNMVNTPAINQLNQLRADNDYYLKQHARLGQQLSKMQQKNKQHKATGSQWMNKSNKINQQKGQIQAKYLKLQGDLQIKDKQIQKLQQQIRKYQAKHSANIHQIQLTKQNKQANQRTMKSLQQQINQKQAQIETLKVDIQQKQIKIKSQKQNSQRIQKTFQEVSKRLKQLTQKYKLQQNRIRKFIMESKQILNLQQNQQIQLTEILSKLHTIKWQNQQYTLYKHNTTKFIDILYDKLEHLTNASKYSTPIKYENKDYITEQQKKQLVLKTIQFMNGRNLFKNNKQINMTSSMRESPNKRYQQDQDYGPIDDINKKASKGMGKQLSDLKDKVERYEKNIKILKQKLSKYQSNCQSQTNIKIESAHTNLSKSRANNTLNTVQKQLNVIIQQLQNELKLKNDKIQELQNKIINVGKQSKKQSDQTRQQTKNIKDIGEVGKNQDKEQLIKQKEKMIKILQKKIKFLEFQAEVDKKKIFHLQKILQNSET